MRIAAEAPFRFGDAGASEQGDGALTGGGVVHPFVQRQRFGDLFADAHERIQGGHRLLKDHRDVLAPDSA